MKIRMIKYSVGVNEFYLAAEADKLVLAERGIGELKFRPVHRYGYGNVPVTARLVHQYCEGFAGTSGDIAPYVEMVRTLTER